MVCPVGGTIDPMRDSPKEETMEISFTQVTFVSRVNHYWAAFR